MVILEIFEDSKSVQTFKMKTITNPASCSFKFLDTSNLVLIFRLVPFFSIPSYLLAWLLVSRNKTKVVQPVKKHYLRQMAINFSSVVLLCHIICPILMPPIPGYFMTGFLDDLDANIALPLVLMTHVVLLVAFSILRLFKHQLITLSDLRYTKKFELPVKILKWAYRFCYLMMLIVAVSILPTLSIELESTGFRQEAYQYFNKTVCFCPEMFIADPRKWEIYIPYYLSVIFGGLCTLTGISSVITCLWMMFDSRKIVSRDTLVMQRNFTFILVYQVVKDHEIEMCQFHITEHGLYYLLLISSQGAVNNFTHIVPGLWRKLRKKVVVPTDSRNSRKGSSMWSTSTHLTASIS
ncbi:Protein CBG05001 [Caenorhabditis briggsae]|uniref:Protein CBG05001 n=1 Tax=Caenorhabditis briggsae TaxID=6238 RepID=A8WYY6_CAEBR|nr:Protein CBG05001 [Caenorhabditis briggsae]CAP25594.2 Protein CBG05001 [Caenorhabditis briggsae]